MMPDVNAWKSKRTYNDTNVNNKSMFVLFVVKHWIVYRPNTFGFLVVFIWTALKSNTIQMMMTMKKARSGGVPATLTEQSQIERENSWAEEAKLIIVFHVIFDKYTHIINYSAVFGAHIQAPIDCICGANAKTHLSIRFSGICIPHIFFCFVCSFVHSSLFLSAVAIFPCSGCISEYECNIFVRELIFNGSAGSIHVIFAIVAVVNDAVYWCRVAFNRTKQITFISTYITIGNSP